jgi:hypothetical protein
VERLVEPFALIIVEIIRSRPLAKTLEQPMRQIDALGLGKPSNSVITSGETDTLRP